MGSTWNGPRKGQSNKLSPHAVRQVQKLTSKNRRMSADSIALEVAEAEGQTIHCTACVFAWPSSQKEASSGAGSQESPQTVC